MKNKLYKCKHPDCEFEQPILSKGLCNYHRYLERQAEGTLPNQSYSIKPISNKRKKEKDKERGCLNTFFEFQLLKLLKNPKSEESGIIIVEPTTANICHLLPKRKSGGFPSVQCHTDNVIFLTLSEHNRFDKLLDERDYSTLEKEFPNSWNKVCERLKKLLKITTEKNRMYFSLVEYLKLEI